MLSKIKNVFKVGVVLSMIFFSGTGIATSQILPLETVSLCDAHEILELDPSYLCGAPLICQSTFK